MCNLRPPSIRPVLMSAVILLFICSVTVAGEPQIAYRFQSGMPGADHCQAVVTSGYTDGVDLGMTGEVWMLDKDGYRVKAGSLEVMEVNAYMSVCLLDGIALEDNIANANVRFEMKEWTPKDRTDTVI